MTAAWLSAGVAFVSLLVTLGVIVFKLGVANAKLAELVKNSIEHKAKLESLEKEVNGIKLKLAGKIQGVHFD